MMPDWLKEWWPVIALCVAVGQPFLFWLMSKRFATPEQVSAEAEARTLADQAQAALITELRHRLDIVEREIEDMPSHGDLGKIGETLAELRIALERQSTALGALGKNFETLGNQVTRIDEWLRNRT